MCKRIFSCFEKLFIYIFLTLQKKQAKQTSEHDDEHAFREFAELAKEERSREQAIFGPTLALLHRIQASKEVPCSCGETLQPSPLLEVGAVWNFETRCEMSNLSGKA